MKTLHLQECINQLSTLRDWFLFQLQFSLVFGK